MKVLANQYSNILIVAFISFLFSFFIASYISSITEQYSYELYGLFGIIIFLSCFAYLVSTEKLFDTKVFAAQILVGVLFIVNLPSIFFYTKSIDVFLWSAESMVILILGYYLISSVKSEITQREELSAKKIELEEKNTKLVELNATKDEFLSFATHQLKSPLTSIKWGIESLHDSHLAPEQDMLASQIKIVTNQMVRTVNDFLNSAKLEAGQLSITKTKTELAVLVQKIINEFRPIAESKHLQLLGEFPNRRVTVGIDDAKIEQVLANIVDNAIKYTPTGSIVVSICIQRSFAVISVRDTGAGITRSDINKLFKKYVRGSAAKLNTAGSGIGLYLAKQIVELHSGTLTIKSKGKGFGTEFVISLPFTDV